MGKYEKLWTDRSKLISVQSPATQPGLKEEASNHFSPRIDVNKRGVKDENPLLREIYDTTGAITNYKNIIEPFSIYIESIEATEIWNRTNRPLLGGLPPSPQINPNLQRIFKLSKLGNKGFGYLNPILAAISYETAQTDAEKKAAIGNVAGSLIGGGIGQALIPVPGVGYAIGSFLGSFAGSYIAENSDNIMAFLNESFQIQGEAQLVTAEAYIALSKAIGDFAVDAGDVIERSLEKVGEAQLMAAEGQLEFWNSIGNAVSDFTVDTIDATKELLPMIGEENLKAAESQLELWNSMGNAVSDFTVDTIDAMEVSLQKVGEGNLVAAEGQIALSNSISDAFVDAYEGILNFWGLGGSNKNQGPSTIISSIPIPQTRVPLNKEAITFQEFLTMTSPQRSLFYPTGVMPDSQLSTTQGQSPINVTLAPGTVQLAFSSSEIDYEELSTNIGNRIIKAIQQAIANRPNGGLGKFVF